MRNNTLLQWPVWLALLGLLLGYSTPAQAGAANSGIAGQTFVHDPRTVNLLTGQVGFTAPFPASLRVYSVGSDRLVTTVTTDSAGRFRVPLRPGLYRVVPDTMWQGRVLQAGEVVVGSYETAPPTTIRVRGHRFSPLTITYERAMGL